MEKVGFIGVGIMGGAIAAVMVRKGIPVLAYDRDPEVLARAVAQGCTPASSAREVADHAEIVFACLPNATICRAVTLGPDGLMNGKAIKIYIDLSTIGGDAAIEIADGLKAHGIDMIDAPVVGAIMALETGDLGVITSGPKASWDKAKFALDSFAGRLFYLGEKVGMGQAGKVMSNAVSYAALLSTCEAVATGLKAGIDMQTAVDIINQGSGANFFSQRVMPNFILKGKYSGTGSIQIGAKDVKLFIEEAQRLHVDTPVAKAISAIQAQVLPAGDPDRDTMTYIHYFTDLAGVPRQG